MVAQVVLEIDIAKVFSFYIYSCVGFNLMYQLHSVTKLCCLILLVILSAMLYNDSSQQSSFEQFLYECSGGL